MRTKFIISLFIFSLTTGFSQKYTYERIDAVTTIVLKEKIKEATLMSQLMPDYPAEYFSKMIDYVSVEIVTSAQGKTLSALSNGDVLTQGQKSLLNSADYGTMVNLKIKFTYKDSKEDMRGSNSRVKEMEYAFLLAPQMEASYSGGYPQLTLYLDEKVFQPVSLMTKADKILNVMVTFSINENGQVIDSKLIGTSSYGDIDKMVLEAIGQMPNWKPAENSVAAKVKQVFTLKFKFNSGGC